MRMAITLAHKGSGSVSPNPLVGAVLVKDGRIIGKGYHEFFGGPHAEVNAISHAKEPVEGSTLYVTLEPCIHQGKTPPCAPFIAEKGIRKVIIGMIDPNPMVKGKGITYLKNNGIKVTTGVLESKINKQNEAFVKYITTGLPFCFLKTAMTLDGKIASVSGQSRWISGERSRLYVHKLRYLVDAVMVGINTVLIDNPLLRSKIHVPREKDPLKIVLDSKGRIPLDANVLKVNPQLSIIASTEMADKNRLKAIERMGAQVLICPSKEGRIDLQYLVRQLGTMGISHVMIEAGSTLAFSVLKGKIADKVLCFIAPKMLGGKDAPSAVGGEGIPDLEKAIQLQDIEIRKIGDDLLLEGYLKNKD